MHAVASPARSRRIGIVVLAFATALVVPFAGTANAAETRMPVTRIVQNPCTQEVVVITAIAHVSTQQQTAADGTVTFRVFDHTSELEGVGISGTIYHGTMLERDTTTVVEPPFPSTTTMSQHWVLSSQGSLENWHLRTRMTVTVDATGNPVPTMEVFENRCVG